MAGDTSRTNVIGWYSIRAIAFLSGAVVLLLEILASRILAPYLGTSFSVWVNIIGTILAALSLGYFLGGILADRNPRLLPWIFLVAAILCSMIYAGKTLLPHLAALGILWGPLVAAILFFAPSSAILGMVSPFLIKIATSNTAELGRTSGGLFAASTLGSIAGTFAGGFWLIPHFPVSRILAGVIVLLLGLSLWSAGGSLKRYWPLSAAALILVAVVLQRTTLPVSKNTIFEKNSLYYNIRVNDMHRSSDDAPMRWLLLDGSPQAARFLDTPDPALPYTDLSLKLIQSLKPAPESVLALGGGGYTIPEFIKRQSPQSDVTVVEIDPEVTATAERYFLNDPGIPITTINADARIFLNENRKQYDIVYTDVYSSGFSVPPSLASREAFQLMRRAMKPDGILVLNICSAREGAGATIYQALYRTVADVFSGITVYSTSRTLSEPQGIILIASNGNAFPEDVFPNTLRPFRSHTPPAPGVLLTDDFAPTDYLVRNLVRAIYSGLQSQQ